ncbi:hypothetical protein AHAS_Ahas06G0176000 [Arachis hypogaea]
MLPRDDQYVPNRKYIRPTAAPTSRTEDPARDILSPSVSQAPSTNQLLRQILQRLDRKEHRNKCQFTYLKELIVGNHPPTEELETLDSTSTTSTGSHADLDCGDDVTRPPCS